MSAASIFFQYDSVHVLTDGAITDEKSGRLLAITPKAIILPHLQAVLTLRGTPAALFAAAQCIDATFATFDDLRRAAADLARRTHDAAAVDFDLLLAGWSESSGRPTACVVTSHTRHGFPAFAPQPVTGLSIAPGDKTIIERFADLLAGERPETADPVKVARALATAQRERGQVSRVGGFAQLSTIYVDRIETRVVIRWPDRVGEVIVPTARAA